MHRVRGTGAEIPAIGLGTCGHCHMDDKMVCVDGPVFNREELKKLEVPEFME